MFNRQAPNVVLILADDLGYGDLSRYGNPVVETPNLDRLAAEGVCLNQHYSASPICAPARGALLTGRYNHRIGAFSVESSAGVDRIGLREATIADDFKAAGHATGMVGKWHSGLHDARYLPYNRGFQEFFGFANGGMDYHEWICQRNGTPVFADGRYLTDVFTDEAIGFVRRHRKEPFFLHLAYNAPHTPFQALPEDLKKYQGREGITDAVAILYAMMDRMDQGIGRLLETLDDLGLSENTVVVFTSDNGPMMFNRNGMDTRRFNGPFRGAKLDVLEGGIRVPAIVRWPAGLKAGLESAAPIHFCDWMPTLLGLTGVPHGGLPFDGQDILGDLETDQAARERRMCWQFNRYLPVSYCNAAIREGDWKLYWPWIEGAEAKRPEDQALFERLIHEPHFEMAVNPPDARGQLPPPAAPELYNLAEDTREERNLAEEHPERVDALKRSFENWFNEVLADSASPYLDRN